MLVYKHVVLKLMIKQHTAAPHVPLFFQQEQEVPG